MSVGDVRNNFEKLRRLLIRVKYDKYFNAERILAGDSSELLPILHYGLLGCSSVLAKHLVDRGYEIFSKNDSKFMEGVYKICRNVFQYYPRLSVSQFLSTGFGERKLIFVADVIKLCMTHHNQLAREIKAKLSSTRPRRRDVGAFERLTRPKAVAQLPADAHDAKATRPSTSTTKKHTPKPSPRAAARRVPRLTRPKTAPVPAVQSQAASSPSEAQSSRAQYAHPAPTFVPKQQQQQQQQQQQRAAHMGMRVSADSSSDSSSEGSSEDGADEAPGAGIEAVSSMMQQVVLFVDSQLSNMQEQVDQMVEMFDQRINKMEETVFQVAEMCSQQQQQQPTRSDDLVHAQTNHLRRANFTKPSISVEKKEALTGSYSEPAPEPVTPIYPTEGKQTYEQTVDNMFVNAYQDALQGANGLAGADEEETVSHEEEEESEYEDFNGLDTDQFIKDVLRRYKNVEGMLDNLTQQQPQPKFYEGTML